METILHQGKPGEGDPHWHPLPEHSVASYKALGYQVRELVLRSDAEQAKVEHFNAALEQAADLVLSTATAQKIRALKMKPAKVAK